MNLRSALNNGFLFLSLGAVFVGLLKVENFDIIKFTPFLFFFVFFRVKVWLDDAEYFYATKRRNIWFDLGLVCAIIAWSLWGLAGYSIADFLLSYRLTMWAIVFLTIWIFLDAIHQKNFKEHRPRFIMTNALYIGALLIMTCESCSLGFPKEYLSYVLLCGTIVDFLFTGSLKKFQEKSG